MKEYLREIDLYCCLSLRNRKKGAFTFSKNTVIWEIECWLKHTVTPTAVNQWWGYVLSAALSCPSTFTPKAAWEQL